MVKVHRQVDTWPAFPHAVAYGVTVERVGRLWSINLAVRSRCYRLVILP